MLLYFLAGLMIGILPFVFHFFYVKKRMNELEMKLAKANDNLELLYYKKELETGTQVLR